MRCLSAECGVRVLMGVFDYAFVIDNCKSLHPHPQQTNIGVGNWKVSLVKKVNPFSFCSSPVRSHFLR